MKRSLTFLFLLTGFILHAQTSKLTVEYIMQDPKWIGTSPSNPYWTRDGELFFNWNPTKQMSDSLYFITLKDKTPRKATAAQQLQVVSSTKGNYNEDRSGYVYENAGDIYLQETRTGKIIRITKTVDIESSPVFTDKNNIAFTRNQNLYQWSKDGTTIQLTNFQKVSEPKKEVLDSYEAWLKENQLATSEVLRERKKKRDSSELKNAKGKELRPIYISDKIVSRLQVSPNGYYITYTLSKPMTNPKATIVPDYMNESGFTQDLKARAKVGVAESGSEVYLYDTRKDTILLVKTNELPGIKDPVIYDIKKPLDSTSRKQRLVNVNNVSWNSNATFAIMDIRSMDNKDRWLMLMDSKGMLTLLDRQRDEAWVGGPGLFSQRSLWLDNNNIWFQSEASGYSHLYTMNVESRFKKALTKGNFEIQQASLSTDKSHFYITTNQVHPGEQHVYRLPVQGGDMVRLSSMTGAHQVVISPDEKTLAYLYSYSNKPWELYLQENKTGARPVQITSLAQSEEFKKYNWRDPSIVKFKARDGQEVFARLYKSNNAHSSKPAVIFVHGAGYLQNAHKWWSSYFREYMFHNLLADMGYTVLDVDYRGSAGYGRDWRTGIYRSMGGKDLTDHIDAAKYLVDSLAVNPKNIGIYGGSYGGFITLMAMFTHPEVFAAGAALRSVTDWAHYNHGYTSNILNTPVLDSIAYRVSSPIYYAEGLKGALLMCHGMVDVNVHFQDIVRLTQRLIELKKENWELAVYPVEDHAFTEPSSWTDEYKRILKLFENNLKK